MVIAHNREVMMGVRIFATRAEAGELLANAVCARKPERPVVLALPRGGVPVAVPVAAALHAPLDLVLVRKIGMPSEPELAAGAVVDGDHPEMILNEDVIATYGVSAEYIREEAARQLAVIEKRRNQYLKGRVRAAIQGRTAIIVDDGIATGATIRAAVKAVRRQNPSRIILAVPVAASTALAQLETEVDDIVCLQTPEYFGGVGMFYRDFSQVEDAEVATLLAAAQAMPRAD
jgi:putative phosphoribosyl transferase